MSDTFSWSPPGATHPATNAAAVTPSASALTYITRALYVGTAGNVVVTMQGGGTLTFTSVPSGSILPLRVTHVTAATTAANIVALW